MNKRQLSPFLKGLRDGLPIGAGYFAVAFGLGIAAQKTGMSPLQCHKHLRLHKAQRLMVGGGESASRAASLVGYESEAQFNREYKRLFGSPPSRDAREKTGRLK